MDRRVFLGNLSAVALGTTWQARPFVRALAFASHANPAPGTQSVAVFDPTLAEGRMLAYRTRCAGRVAWAVGDRDIGGLWHTQLAQRLPPGAALIGALRPSDRFVLARLAAARCVTLRDFAPRSSTDADV